MVIPLEQYGTTNNGGLINVFISDSEGVLVPHLQVVKLVNHLFHTLLQRYDLFVLISMLSLWCIFLSQSNSVPQLW